MYKHILLATDGSEAALRAATTAADLARLCGARLTVVTAFEVPPVAGRDESETPLADEEAVRRFGDAVLRRAMERTAPALRAAGAEFQERCEIGRPAAVIVDTAARFGVDVIVMGCRGLGGAESFLIGSVTDHVLHHASCAVLVVK